ncbi:hypothetical protein J31TS4_33660 [Paenibacillus sp. J31TS4]|uniref:hypothetical protein n=1 Tax=Paenibacillus sp. J31TS4 TaxID=2807195 RepID=UPI001B1069AD|nr:hypothetical protein [Paenibacillus sp. J31TS4]GIP40086.1 hypothetical protein J31TS4_33660 [Paenibacillus sp. J31TS4]
MTKKLQAYFCSEDEALAAQTKLQTFATPMLEVGELPGPIGSDLPILAPYAPISEADGVFLAGTGDGSMGGGRGLGAVAAFRELDRMDHRDTEERKGQVVAGTEEDRDWDPDDFRYVLSCEVADEDYDEIVEVLRQNRGYVEVFKG